MVLSEFFIAVILIYVCLKTLLQGLSELEFYGDLVYKFRKIVGKADFSVQFKKIVTHYKNISYTVQHVYSAANCMHGC